MSTVHKIQEQVTADELLVQFTEELRTTGCTNFALLDRCPAQHQRKLRSLMNMAALMHWAADRAAKRTHDQHQHATAVGQRSAPR